MSDFDNFLIDTSKKKKAIKLHNINIVLQDNILRKHKLNKT